MGLLSVRDLERTSRVLMRKAAVLHRVVQLDLESLAAADFTPHRECATEHRRPRRKSRSEEHTSELPSPCNLVCRLLLETKKKNKIRIFFLKKKKKIYNNTHHKT